MKTPASIALADLLKRLRGDESQVNFGAKLGYLRQTYESYELGDRRPRGPQLWDALIQRFPDDRTEIEKVRSQVEAERRASGTRRTATGSPEEKRLQRMVAGSIRVGRVSEATASIERMLDRDLSAPARLWFLNQLADIKERAGKPDEARAALQLAIETAHAADLHEDEVKVRLTLARILQSEAEFQAAHAVLDEGLRVHPDAGRLWRRKGITYWYQHDYPHAYACLMAAKASGVPLARLVHTRGQVLAEWGNYAAAIADLTLAIDKATSPANEAYARSTRAYALANLGEIDEAFREFSIAEAVRPDNAWLHYFRALCHGKIGEEDQLIEGLQRALISETPKLNPAKRESAISILKEHGVSAPRNK